jgi:CheY-like chemotaxis protein
MSMTLTRRIMVVDDEQPVTEMIRMSLEELGDYDVREVNDARDAVAVAREFRPDLILMDVMMPDLDGGDVAAELGKDPDLVRVPVVYMTALVGPEEAPVGGLVSGHHRFLPKPASIAELLDTLDEVLGGGTGASPAGG